MEMQNFGSRRSSIHQHEEVDAKVNFVHDTSGIWYKPDISRKDAIEMLRGAPPGTFVIRHSESSRGSFGLSLKVARPQSDAPSSSKDLSNELVRHFLIERTLGGFRLKGDANEPEFSSLSALIYQHSLKAMALPCQLVLPKPSSSPQKLLALGVSYYVHYLFTMDSGSLPGPQAIKNTVTAFFDQKPLPRTIIVDFKISSEGITLTDHARTFFFSKHYPTSNISYCGLDTEQRSRDFVSKNGFPLGDHRCFGFVANNPVTSDNQCHIFVELSPELPASAVVTFVKKVLMSSR